MESQFWLEKWQENKIAFHQLDINKRLVEFWPQLTGVASKNQALLHKPCVFVPLCGKSTDMLWLHQQGHDVLGVELSETAARAFFDDNQLPCITRHIEDFVCYEGIEAGAGINLLAGDYFALTPAHTLHCTHFYDRAALIALQPAMRQNYVKHLAELMSVHTEGLLLAISYNQAAMQGPPFSVPDDEVYHLFAEYCNIFELAHYSGPRHVGNLAERGLETLDERAYLIKRKC